MMTSSSASTGTGTGTENVKQSISVPINAATDGEIVASRADIAKSLVPEIRVLESVSSKTSDFQHPVQNSHQLHLQQVHVLKAVAADDTVPRGSGLSIKTTNTSPLKGPTVLTLPFHKIAQNSKLQTRLQVGDTLILSPASTLACEHTLESVSVVSEKSGRIMFSTPTKLHMKTSAVTEQPAQRTSLTQCHLGPFTSSVSPAHHSSVSASPWASSPIQYKRGKEHRQQEILSDIIKKARRTPGTDKGSKGLRHFAMLVCEKVKQKITTTYNEVADELVTEYSNSQKQLSDQQYDQKNIRRRVYDALNVLMAMNIIYKDKKDIHWVGLPTNSAQELKALESEKHKRELRVKQKTAQLHELILQQIAFKNLVQRNRRSQQTQGPPASNSAIQLPFIVVNTGKKTVIDCSISNDKYEYLFNFDNTFEIHDDIEVLKRMGLAYGLENGTCKREDLRVAQSLVPPVLKPHLEEMAGFSRVNTSLGDSSSPSLSLESSHYSCSASETAHTCFGEPKFHASVGSQGNRREKESCMAENENRLHSDCNLAVIPEDITAHADAFNFPPTAPTS